MELENLPFRLESSLVSSFFRLNKACPSSAPFLSGDGFRSLCSQNYERGSEASFDPARLRPNTFIFCDAWLLKDFLSGPARSIDVPFSIISHNGDPNLDDDILPLLPPKLLRLFGQNTIARDPRLVPIPIGLENRRLHYNGVVGDFEKLRKKPTDKKPRILSGFTIGTNEAIRRPALKALKLNPLNDSIDRMNARAYRKLAVKYMFIASPPGNGVDCHRTWEAMYLRSVPIVIRSPMTESFSALGLPLCLVDSYDEVAVWGESELVSIYDRLSPGFENEALWFGYWERKIRQEDISGGLKC